MHIYLCSDDEMEEEYNLLVEMYSKAGYNVIPWTDIFTSINFLKHKPYSVKESVMLNSEIYPDKSILIIPYGEIPFDSRAHTKVVTMNVYTVTMFKKQNLKTLIMSSYLNGIDKRVRRHVTLD